MGAAGHPIVGFLLLGAESKLTVSPLREDESCRTLEYLFVKHWKN